MESRNVYTFLRVAELKSFTRAAEHLGYAQSTVTLQVQQLEQEIGAPLFDRINKRVSLTAAGEKMIEYANDMMHLETKMHEIGKKSSEVSGLLRVGTTESLLSSYLYQQIPEYCKRYPDVKLEVETNSSLNLLQSLRQNDLDIALTLGSSQIDRDMMAVCSYSEDMIFVTSPSNPFCREEKLYISDLCSQPIILPERDSIYRQALENGSSQSKLELNCIIQINHTSTIVDFLLRGLGFSFLPRYLVSPYLRTGQLVSLNVRDFQIQAYYVHLLHHANKWITPQIEKFIQIIKETY